MQDHGSNTISGSVHRIISKSAESGWAAIEVDSQGQPMMVVGSLAHVDEGLRIEADGAWAKHQHFGWQFKVSSARLFAPATKEGIERFLRSGAVAGIGPVFAKKIVSKFGDDTLRVISEDQWRLKYLKGVGPKRIKAIVQGVKEYRDRMEVMSFLHGKLGPVRAQRVYEKYGDKAREIIAANPYRLIDDFDGMGFKIADEVARDVGVGLDDALRLRAAVLTILHGAARQGHTCLPVLVCKQEALRLLETEDRAAKAISQSNANVWHEVEKDGVTHLELEKYEFLEQRICAMLKQHAAGVSSVPTIDASLAIPWAEERIGILLEDSQKAAVALALKEQICVITGGPGVGKTTILNSILRILCAKKVNVLLAAPTGRAARRMSESTGHDAETIHKLLDNNPRLGGFQRNRNNPLVCDALFIDEASMIDLSLARALLEALPANAKLVLVGDHEQLPSVGPGQVLGDVIESGVIPVARLTEVFRQVADSPIIRNAHAVNAGLVPELDLGTDGFEFVETKNGEETAAAIVEMMCTRLPGEGVDVINDAIALIPMNRNVVGVDNLNQLLQARLNPTPASSMVRNGKRYGVGDKVIQKKNNRDLQVFNGDIGVIRAIDEANKILHIVFDGTPVEYPFNELWSLGLAYATTVHKGQGSEYKFVVMAVDMSNTVLLDRKLLYTAITRARSRIILIGQRRAVHIAVSASRANVRRTKLKDRLQEAFAARD